MLTLNDHTLSTGTLPLLTNVPDTVTLTDGHWLHISQPAASRIEQPLGTLAPGRFLAAYRNEPFWMRPATGRLAHEIPVETQFLFLELPGNLIALVVPLIDGVMRCALQGRGSELLLVAESGTPALTASNIRAIYITVGRDLHTLCETAAAEVAAALATTTRQQKHLPAFINDFGWCTWDAFYQHVSPEKIREGLASFRAAGIPPKLLIIDDGWQSVENQGDEIGHRLTALHPNEKFAGDLGPTVRMAKNEFGVRHVLAWHALQGYWGGIDPLKMSDYHALETPRDFSQGVRHHWPEANTKWWGRTAGIITPQLVGKFLHDYHALLARMGIDGVKVDNQAALEGLAANHGRVAMYHHYHAALEQSANEHFHGNLLNCMACANDLLYTMQHSALTRTSTDFWPDKPESHGLHIWTNAVVATWFGQFIHPDWDMFQSVHPRAAFHAAARAISGGPIYVSDKPGQHNAALLRKLVLSDGTILRCDRPATITRDSLFTNPLQNPDILKIWNTNNAGQNAVIGLFNCHHATDPAAAPLKTTTRPRDVPTLLPAHGPFIIHRVHANQTHLAQFDEPIDISLSDGEWELLHLIPLGSNRAAVIGLIDRFNPPAAIITQGWINSDTLEITLRDGGELALWCVIPPDEIHVLNCEPTWTTTRNIIRITIPPGGPRHVTVAWVKI